MNYFYFYLILFYVIDDNYNKINNDSYNIYDRYIW